MSPDLGNTVSWNFDRAKAFKGAMAGLILTAPAASLAVASGGAGHGDYFWALLLFPVPCLLILSPCDLDFLGLLTGALQFSCCGAALGVTDEFGLLGRETAWWLTGIFTCHVVLVAAAMVLLPL